MKFGLMYSFVVPPGSSMTHLDTFREMNDLVPLAESLGFDSFQTTEHHFQDNGWAPSPLVILAKAAGLSETMRLVSNILVLPLYDPLRLVEDVVTLDNLCEGRLTLGVSPGYVSEEFAAYGIPHEERFQRAEEILDILEKSWREEVLEHDGRFYRIPPTRVIPRPVQSPIPIWYGVSGPKLLKRAAERRCPVTASPRHTVDELVEHYARYDSQAAEVGYTTKERPVIREVFVAPTTRRAEALAGPAVTHLFSLYGRKSAAGERQLRNDKGQLITDEAQVDFRTFASRYVIGDPASACEQLKDAVDRLQPSELICRMQLPGIPTEDLEKSLRLFAEQVMPRFR
jgi:alkanesulfonate monooxygenase SsuD/methylene tetrahydromethanopterin reductase-like flavin-dependent oxidoreductase (luciferase family)